MPLDGPSFFAHNTEGTLVETFLQDTKAASPNWRVGGCLLLPRWWPSTQTDFAARLLPHTDYLLGDPDTRRMHLPFGDRGRARNDLAYLTESDPLVNRSRFTANSLNAQVLNGRDIVITPWLIHGLSGNDRELKATVDFASRAKQHQLAKGRTLLMGLEATAEVLSKKSARDAFIDEVVEADLDLPVYLRMTIDPPESRKPFGNTDALLGLRATVDAFANNDIDVVLPQVGLVGWLMLPFGAQSFGAGATSSMERNVRPSGGGGGGGTQPLHWYFSIDLLGPVLAEELSSLKADGLITDCNCPYCTSTPPASGTAFNRQAADLHFLWWCAYLANEARQADDATAAVRTRVEAAQQLWTRVRAARVPLDPRSSETHLAAWSAAIA